MKKNVILVFLFFNSIFLFAQNDSLLNHVQRIVRIDYWSVDSVNKTIRYIPVFKELDSTDLFFDFIDYYYCYSSQVMSFEFGSLPKRESYSSAKNIDSFILAKKEEFVKKLLNSKTFNLVIKYYLNSKSEQRYTDVKPIKIGLNELVIIASRYFNIAKIVEDKPQMAFCGGEGNPYLLQPELNKDIIAQAFVYQALKVYLHYDKQEELWNNFVKKDVLVVDYFAQLDKNMSEYERLVKTRTYLWNEMEKDENIKKAILNAYKKSNKIIPIEIIE